MEQVFVVRFTASNGDSTYHLVETVDDLGTFVHDCAGQERRTDIFTAAASDVAEAYFGIND